VTEQQNASNQAGWQRVAREYAGDDVGEDDPDLRRELRDRFCSRLRGRRVLEVGCGPGTDAAQLAERGLQVTATDFAPEFVAVVRERYPELDARVMDMTQPDLPPATFDGILGMASFVHVPRALADRSLTGLRELLVPGGLLGLWVIHSSKGITDYTIERWAGDPACSMLFTCYSTDEITERLTGAGYADVECVLNPHSDLYANLPRLVERGISGYQVFARRPL
jgi:SAM-dependent methyltransferase